MKKTLIATTLVLLLFACSKHTLNTEQAPVPLANATGLVTLYDSANKAVTNCGGVTVSLNNNSYTATTDSAGEYFFKNVPQGVYTFTYSKAGYSTHVVYNADVQAGATAQVIPTRSLYMPSSAIANIASASLYNSTIQYLVFLGNVPQFYNSNAVVFLSNSASVSSTNYITSSYVLPSFAPLPYELSASFNPYPYFSSDSVVYFKVYPTYTNASYTDITTGKTVYEGLGKPSAADSVIIQ